MMIKKVPLSEEVIQFLIELSVLWESEDSCFGYRKNTVDDLTGEDIFLAEDEGEIIGYLLCHKYIQEKDVCTVPKESKCLEVEELYVIPEYRSRGIGRRLYNEAVSHYGDQIEFVTLSTATKNYRAILHFYIEELGMTFWSARLFQRLDH